MLMVVIHGPRSSAAWPEDTRFGVYGSQTRCVLSPNIAFMITNGVPVVFPLGIETSFGIKLAVHLPSPRSWRPRTASVDVDDH
jgi:hypothetical protein